MSVERPGAPPATSLEPPPMRLWSVEVDSPELPGRHRFEIEARVEVEAQVSAAEVTLMTIPEEKLSAKFRRRKRETQVADVAKYAVATPK